MTETRKAIIELIEPYIDNKCGLYDITAVLKYISSTKPYFTSLDIDGNLVIYKTSDDLVNLKSLGFIISKPLHLYTEQEEKELLDLLLKLK